MRALQTSMTTEVTIDGRMVVKGSRVVVVARPEGMLWTGTTSSKKRAKQELCALDRDTRTC